MNTQEYEDFYNKVRASNGWDFSSVKCTAEGNGIDLYSDVVQHCSPSTLLLDIGTGGGEAVLSISEKALLLVGIDQSSGMIGTALRNLKQSNTDNVRFLEMSAEKLDFPDGFFDVVSCRHSMFDAAEVARVLKKGGIFLTQQVAENDKTNLKQAFGRGQSLGVQAGTLMQQYVDELIKAGFTGIQPVAADVTEYYETAEDLIFLLKHTPIIPQFGESDGDFKVLKTFIEENQSEKGIRTNSARFMITAKLS